MARKHDTNNDFFAPLEDRVLMSVADGLSNTLMMGEMRPHDGVDEIAIIADAAPDDTGLPTGPTQTGLQSATTEGGSSKSYDDVYVDGKIITAENPDAEYAPYNSNTKQLSLAAAWTEHTKANNLKLVETDAPSAGQGGNQGNDAKGDTDGKSKSTPTAVCYGVSVLA